MPRLPEYLGDLIAVMPWMTLRPHVLALPRRSDKLTRQPPSGALDSGHVIVAILSAIPGSVCMLIENFIDEEIRCL